jgi:hypothetical protein
MERFVVRLEGRSIHCVWMDDLTATYTSDYVCQSHCSANWHIRFLGDDADEWISALRDSR